jgi:uncharacterized protein YcfL
MYRVYWFDENGNKQEEFAETLEEKEEIKQYCKDNNYVYGVEKL